MLSESIKLKIEELIPHISRFYNLQLSIRNTNRLKRSGSNLVLASIDNKGQKYAIRIFRAFNPVRLKNELALRKEMQDKGIKTTSLLLSPTNKVLFSYQNTYATVSPWINGRHPKYLNRSGYHEIGRALASFHDALYGIELDSTHLFVNPEKSKMRLKRLDRTALTIRIGRLLEYVNSVWGAQIPSGVLHGDFHSENILIDGKDVVILDLQSSGNGPLVLDIGRSIVDICSDKNGRVDKEKVGIFLSGYESVRVLEETEREYLLSTIIFAAGAIAAWGCEHNNANLTKRFLRIGESLTDIDHVDALLFN